MEVLNNTWPWYIAGPLITLTLFLLLYWGKTFGVSGNYRVMCAVLGAGKTSKFFDFDWKKEKWNLVFILGALIGGYIAHEFLSSGEIPISDATIMDLEAIGITVGTEMVPTEIFDPSQLFTLRTIIFVVVGGFLVGFGTRWAGGCTSGHAITGLSNLQLPSLIAVIGFFIGGLFVTHLLLPYLVSL